LHTNEMKRLHLQKINRYPPLYLRILVKSKAQLDVVRIRARIGQIRLIFDALVDPASHRPTEYLAANQDGPI